jgi:hypothetical protein
MQYFKYPYLCNHWWWSHVHMKYVTGNSLVNKILVLSRQTSCMCMCVCVCVCVHVHRWELFRIVHIIHWSDLKIIFYVDWSVSGVHLCDSLQICMNKSYFHSHFPITTILIFYEHWVFLHMKVSTLIKCISLLRWCFDTNEIYITEIIFL